MACIDRHRTNFRTNRSVGIFITKIPRLGALYECSTSCSSGLRAPGNRVEDRLKIIRSAHRPRGISFAAVVSRELLRWPRRQREEKPMPRAVESNRALRCSSPMRLALTSIFVIVLLLFIASAKAWHRQEDRGSKCTHLSATRPYSPRRRCCCPRGQGS